MDLIDKKLASDLHEPMTICFLGWNYLLLVPFLVLTLIYLPRYGSHQIIEIRNKQTLKSISITGIIIDCFVIPLCLIEYIYDIIPFVSSII